MRSLVSILALAGCAADPRPSIVLIVVDTLRSDAVSSIGQTVGTTPEIDALARDGVRYERAYASAPWTLPSHATILTGLPPQAHDTYDNGAEASQRKALGSGYRT
ncbi:MAG: sulfatase-like hydrolase/transferase, partial [Myxococcota bacterium]